MPKYVRAPAQGAVRAWKEPVVVGRLLLLSGLAFATLVFAPTEWFLQLAASEWFVDMVRPVGQYRPVRAWAVLLSSAASRS
jgi:hypothetical protein